MGRTKQAEVRADLSRAAGRLERWRQGRMLGERIPAVFWREAVELAGRHGVHRTASTLRLDYYQLKRRFNENSPPQVEPVPRSAECRFEELPATAFAAPLECVIQFEHRGGAKLRIEWRGSTAPDVAALGRDFWGAG
jgi:hypothetical protein